MIRITWQNNKTNRSGLIQAETTDAANLSYYIDNNLWGFPNRWKLSTDGSHTKTKESISTLTNEPYTEYFFPCEYTYEIKDITEEYNKQETRRKLLSKRRNLKKLCDNILHIIGDYIESNNFTETEENAFETKLSAVDKMLAKNRIKKLKSSLSAKATDSVFTEDLKSRLLEEFEYFGL